MPKFKAFLLPNLPTTKGFFGFPIAMWVESPRFNGWEVFNAVVSRRRPLSFIRESLLKDYGIQYSPIDPSKAGYGGLMGFFSEDLALVAENDWSNPIKNQRFQVMSNARLNQVEIPIHCDFLLGEDFLKKLSSYTPFRDTSLNKNGLIMNAANIGCNRHPPTRVPTN